MTILPFRYKVYESTLSFDEIYRKLQEKTDAAKENLDIGKMIDSDDILEMRHGRSSFFIGKRIGELKHGKLSVYPVVMAKLKTKSKVTKVYVKIRPYSFFFPTFGMLLITPVIFVAIRKADYSALGIAVFVLTMLYLNVLIGFNKEYKRYLDIVNSVFGGNVK